MLSRQDIPAIDDAGSRASGIASGGYVTWQHDGGDDLAILASGSEVHVAIKAAQRLAAEGTAARVVSMPCWEWFEQADPAWRDAVLPPTLRARVAVEAGRGDAWHRWVGLDGRVVSIEEFGESGPGAAVLERRGITVDAVVDAARSALAA